MPRLYTATKIHNKELSALEHIFLNLKRFDIPVSLGGVNSIAPPDQWAQYIISSVKDELAALSCKAEFTIFFPEAHMIQAASAGKEGWLLGCQGVHRSDVAPGGNFGAFTAGRTAKSMAALGCDYAIIGHCEERRDLAEIIADGGGKDFGAVNRILNQEVLRAQEAGLKVLYCVGEKAEETGRWIEVIESQLKVGLAGADLSRVVIGYEPLWAIGPGRPVPTAEDIRKVALFSKSVVPCRIVYGGGLKEENAPMIASIEEMDGGLIALTNFSGDIGFYPDGYLRIIRSYFSGRRTPTA